MKRFTIPALIVGSSLTAVLIVWSGATEVGQAVAGAGWGALLIVAARAAAVAVAGAGWFVLFPPGGPRLRVCVLLRFVREATNGLLPVAQVGGDLIGARLLTFYRVPGAVATASVIVDVMLQAGTQLVFAVAGLGVLLLLGADGAVVRAAGLGLALAAPMLAAFYVAQRRFGERLLRAALARFAGAATQRALRGVEGVYAGLRSFHASPGRLAASSAVHLGGWFVGVAEVWIALALIGHPVGWGEALVIESLSQAARGAAFMVPGAIGAQEGGLVVVCALFGVPARTALALSLLKRGADLVIGVPGLLGWQALEGRTALRGGEPDPVGSPESPRAASEAASPRTIPVLPVWARPRPNRRNPPIGA